MSILAGKITTEIGQLIMQLAPSQSYREIARSVKQQVGIDLSHQAVAKFVSEQRQERAEVTKAVVETHIRTTLPTDLEILQNMRDQLNNWRCGLDEEGRPLAIKPRLTERLMIVDRLCRVIDTRLKYSGAGEDDGDDKLNKLIEAMDAAADRAIARSSE